MESVSFISQIFGWHPHHPLAHGPFFHLQISLPSFAFLSFCYPLMRISMVIWTQSDNPRQFTCHSTLTPMTLDQSQLPHTRVVGILKGHHSLYYFRYCENWSCEQSQDCEFAEHLMCMTHVEEQWYPGQDRVPQIDGGQWALVTITSAATEYTPTAAEDWMSSDLLWESWKSTELEALSSVEILPTRGRSLFINFPLKIGGMKNYLLMSWVHYWNIIF